MPLKSKHTAVRPDFIDRWAKRNVDTLIRSAAAQPSSDLVLLGKAQVWYLCAVAKLGPDQAYNDRIQSFLSEHYQKEIATGQLSGLAKTLVNHGLIVKKKGGSPSGIGRPISLYQLTSAGLAALKDTLAFNKWKSSYLTKRQQSSPVTSGDVDYGGDNYKSKKIHTKRRNKPNMH